MMSLSSSSPLPFLSSSSPLPSSVTSSLSSSSPLPSSVTSSLSSSQLTKWTTRSTLSSEPFKIENGIPQVTIFVKFPLGLGKELKIPPNIRTREDFMLFLAKNADMNSFEIDRMFTSGRIWAHIQPTNTDLATVDFFKTFVGNPDFVTTPTPPSFIQPVSAERRASFKAHFPSKFSAEPFKIDDEFSLPQINIFVKFPQALGKNLKIPPKIKTREEFLIFLAENAPMPSDIREFMYRTGTISAIVQPIDTDSATVDFFQKFLRNPTDPTPLIPQITIFVKSPYSKALILKVPSNIKSYEEFMPFVGKVAFNMKMPSGIKADIFERREIPATVGLIDSDSRSLNFFRKLVRNDEVSSSLTPIIEPPAHGELPQVNFQMVIDNRVKDTRSWKIPPKINSLNELKVFIRESLAKEGRDIIGSNFSIWDGGFRVLADDNLEEIFSNSPLVLHVFGTTQIAAGLSELPQGVIELPQRLIDVALPWTFSDRDHWDFSDCYHTVRITPSIRSLDDFKLFLKGNLPALRAANFADFDVICMKGDTWIKVENKDELMLYFKQIEKDSVPLLACIERKLPKPDLSKPCPPAPREPEPEPFKPYPTPKPHPSPMFLWLRSQDKLRGNNRQKESYSPLPKFG